jgi:hypothetical protein
MNELMEYIKEITGQEVDREKMFAFLYARKIQASTFYYKLITASRLVRQDYLEAMNDENIWSDDNV